MNETKLDFTKVIDYKNVDNINVLKENASRETHPFLYPTSRIDKDGYIIIDFGTELVGRLVIEFGYNEKKRKIRVRLGESVYETCAELGEKNAGNDHSLRDNEYNVFTWGSLSTSESGFRFARIDNISSSPVEIISIKAYRHENNLAFEGDFACSDAKLNSIYEVARNTISLCVREDDIWDGVKRDRVFWMGDFYPELIGAYFIYGDIPQIKTCLRKISYFTSCWVNSIPSYSAWWLICLEKYYSLSLDKSFLLENERYVDKVISDFSNIIKPNGEISYKDSKLSYFGGNEFFIDWPTNLTKDAEIGFRYLLLITLEKAKNIYSVYKKDTSNLNELISRLDKYGYKPSKFKQVTALGVLANRVAKEDAIPLLKEDGFKGMTCFMGLFIIRALEKLGEGDFALSLIKTYYGAMLEMGATSFFEDFDLDWLKDNPSKVDSLPSKDKKNIHADYGRFCYCSLRHSLCHGWSSGFIYFFYSYILGIKEVEPGYKSIRIEPHMDNLDFARGIIPTSLGLIKIEHINKNGQIMTSLELPEGISLIK